jgi:maltose 6'-phosphate phosphatase
MVKWQNSYFNGYWLRVHVLMAVVLFSGCAKSSETANQPPAIALVQLADGLQIKLRGSVTDPDGTVANVSINWGDQSGGAMQPKDFPAFEVSHIYNNPGDYAIELKATDDAGSITTKIITLQVDFKETSLDGIKSTLYKSSANEFLVLTLNLHTYQESRQNEKLNMITDLIGKMDVDFICFQECGQSRYAAFSSGIIREDNMALLLSARIRSEYQSDYGFVWGWAHYGWNVYEEGVAVMTKYPILHSADRYISTNTSTGSITSRKVIWAACQAASGLFHIFSAHTHWRTTLTDEEQNIQIGHIKSMVAEKETAVPGVFSFVSGDFNGNPTSEYPWSEGYNTMMGTGDYTDTFLDVYPGANQVPAQGIYNTIGGDFPGRIDYIFMKKNSHLQVIDSQIIFTQDIIGTVSDHFGVITKIVIN